jgi:hypothetical protein
MTAAQVNKIKAIFFMTYSSSPVKTSLAFTTGVSCLLLDWLYYPHVED